MKKWLNIGIFSAVMVWMGFVAYHFYKINLYYHDALLSWKTAAFHLFLMAATGILFYFLSPKRQFRIGALLGLVLALAFLSGAYQFLVSDFSIVTGGTLIREGTTVMIVPSGESLEGKDIIFDEGSLVRDTDFILENLHESFAELFVSAPLFKSLGELLMNVSLAMALATVFLLIFSSLGHAIFYRDAKSLRLEQRCIAFFLGAGIFVFPVFILGFFGIYSTVSFLIVLGVALLISGPQLVSSLKCVFLEKISLKEPFWSGIACLAFFTVLMAMNLLDLVRPFPLAWDDINLYMRSAQQFAETNFFPRGIGPSSWTLLQSIPWLFTKSAQGHLSLLMAVLLVGFPLFYSLSRRFLTAPHAMGASVILALLPIVNFFTVIDSKIELPLLFVGVASALAWMEWRETKRNRDFLAFAFLLGFAVSIKITALLWVVVMLLITLVVLTKRWYLAGALYSLFLVYLLLSGQMATLSVLGIPELPLLILFIASSAIFLCLSFWKEKPWTDSKAYLPFLSVVLFVFLFTAPWAIQHYKESQVLSVSNLVFGEKGIPGFGAEYLNACTATTLSFDADYKRYAGFEEGIMGLVTFPWNVTMTPELTGFITDITFLFLGIIPLWILAPKTSFSGDKKLLFMAGTTAVFLSLWALVSSGVIWYGIFGLIPLVILLAASFENKPMWWKIALGIFVLLALGQSFVLRNNFFAEQRMFAYATGLYSYDETLDAFYPGFTGIATALEQDIAAGVDPLIYRVGSQSKFFLPVEDTQIHDDDFLDEFSCFASEYGADNTEQLKKIFTEAGFTHILFHRGSQLNSGSTFETAYQLKRQEFDVFLQNSNWPIDFGGFSLVLLELK